MIILTSPMLVTSDCEFIGCDFLITIPPPTEDEIEEMKRQGREALVYCNCND